MFEKLKSRGMSAIDLVYFAIVVIVGLVIFTQVETSITGLSGAGLAAKNNVTANTYGGFQTISTGPTIIAAVVILGIVGMLMFRGK
jgi:hypothetical protein